MSKDSENALRKVLQYADTLADATRPIRFDGPVETALCQARKAASSQLYAMIGQELGMSTAQLKEFAYSSHIHLDGGTT